MLRGKQLEESIVRQSGSDFNLNEVLRELEEEIQLAAASLEDERAALLRDQILELKNGTGVTKIEPQKTPIKYTRDEALQDHGRSEAAWANAT